MRYCGSGRLAQALGSELEAPCKHCRRHHRRALHGRCIFAMVRGLAFYRLTQFPATYTRALEEHHAAQRPRRGDFCVGFILGAQRAHCGGAILCVCWATSASTRVAVGS